MKKIFFSFIIFTLIFSLFLSLNSQTETYWKVGNKWYYKGTIMNETSTVNFNDTYEIKNIIDYQGKLAYLMEFTRVIIQEGVTTTGKQYIDMNFRLLKLEAQSSDIIIEEIYNPGLLLLNLTQNKVSSWVTQSIYNRTIRFAGNVSEENGFILEVVNVSGIEKVNVKAGSFNAYKIEIFRNETGSYVIQGQVYYYQVIYEGKSWFSLEAKNFVKEEGKYMYTSEGETYSQTITSELVNYEIEAPVTQSSSVRGTTTTTTIGNNTIPPVKNETKTTTLTSSTTSPILGTYTTGPIQQEKPAKKEEVSNPFNFFNVLLIAIGIISGITVGSILYFKVIRKPKVPGETVIYQPPQVQQPQQLSQQGIQICPYCKNILPIQAKFCSRCGNKIS